MFGKILDSVHADHCTSYHCCAAVKGVQGDFDGVDEFSNCRELIGQGQHIITLKTMTLLKFEKDEFEKVGQGQHIITLKTMTLMKLVLKEIYAEDEIGCISEIAKVPKVCVFYCRPSYIMLPIFLNILSKVFIPKNTFVLQIFVIFRKLEIS